MLFNNNRTYTTTTILLVKASSRKSILQKNQLSLVYNELRTTLLNEDVQRILKNLYKKYNRLSHFINLPGKSKQQFINGFHKQKPQYTKTYIKQNLKLCQQHFIEASAKRHSCSKSTFFHNEALLELSKLDLLKEKIKNITDLGTQNFFSELSRVASLYGTILGALDSYLSFYKYDLHTNASKTAFCMHLANDVIKTLELIRYERLAQTNVKLQNQNVINPDQYQVVMTEEAKLLIGDQISGWLEEAEVVTLKTEVTFERKKPKTTDKIVFNEKILALVTSSTIKPEKLPSLVEPRDWTISDEIEYNTNALNGGLLTAQNFLVRIKQPAWVKDINNRKKLVKRTRDQGITTFVSEEALTIINKLQKVPFKVNNDLVIYLLKNFQRFLEEEEIEVHKYKNWEDFLGDSTKKRTKKHKHAENRSQLNEITFILDSIFAALAYNKVDIFFARMLDFRSRIYAAQYPIGPMGAKLSRSLIQLKDDKDKNSFDVSYDVTGSGFQIIGLLLADEFLLEKTKFLVPTEKGQDDLYVHTQKMLLKEKYPTLEENKITRELIKDILMTHTYNETLYGLKVRLSDDNEDFSRYLSAKGVRVYDFAEKVKTYMDEIYPNIKRLREVITEMVNKTTTPFSFNRTFLSQINIYYTKKDNVRVRSKARGKTIQMQLKVETHPLQIDYKKARIAIMPSYIHANDAQLLLKTIQKLLDAGIPITVSHDSIRTKPKYAKEVSNAYMSAAIEIYVKPKVKPFEELIKQHSLENDYYHTINSKFLEIENQNRFNYDDVLSLEKDKNFEPGFLEKKLSEEDGK